MLFKKIRHFRMYSVVRHRTYASQQLRFTPVCNDRLYACSVSSCIYKKTNENSNITVWDDFLAWC